MFYVPGPWHTCRDAGRYVSEYAATVIHNKCHRFLSAHSKLSKPTSPASIQPVSHNGSVVVMCEPEAAINAFEKALAMKWGAQGGPVEPGEAREKARELAAGIEQELHVEVLRNWYDDADAEFLQHVGLPADTRWDQWRAHYTADDCGVDMERVGNDLRTFPPIAVQIEEIIAERAAEEQRRQL